MHGPLARDLPDYAPDDQPARVRQPLVLGPGQFWIIPAWPSRFFARHRGEFDAMPLMDRSATAATTYAGTSAPDW